MTPAGSTGSKPNAGLRPRRPTSGDVSSKGSVDHIDTANGSIDAQALATLEFLARALGADDSGNTHFAGDDRGMADVGAGVDHDGAGNQEEGRPARIRRGRDQDIAGLEVVAEFSGVEHHARCTHVNAGACAKALDAVARRERGRSLGDRLGSGTVRGNCSGIPRQDSGRSKRM